MSRWFWPTVRGIPYHLRVLHSQRCPSIPTPALLPAPPAAVDHGLGPTSTLASYLSMREEDISQTPALTFKSLYLSVKDCTMIRCLRPKQMTFMISMFGSLSIRPSPQSCIYVLKVVPCVTNPIENTYWPFVLEIARDKEKLGYPLNGTDRFWIMRAELAGLSTSPDVSAQLAQRCISRAMQQYTRIWRHTPDPEVHAPLLEALLSNPSSRNLSDALKRLLRVLSIHGNPHQRLLNIFWKIVLEHGATLSSTQKSDILSLCFDRVGRFDVCGKSQASTSNADIPKLGTVLAGRLFPWYLARLPHNDLQHWVSKITVAAFQPSLSPETRWSNLLLLAICVNPHDLKSVASSSHLELAPETIEWRTILILSTLERAVTNLPVSHNLANILRSLWRMWKGIDRDRPLLASQAVVASFLRLSSIAKDKEILRDCVQYSEARELWSISENRSDVAGGIHVFTSYMIGLVNCHGRKWSCILDIVDSTATTDAWRTKVVSALLDHFIVHDIMTAHEIYQSVLKRSFYVPPAYAYNVATRLVAVGQLEDAAQLLQTPSLPLHLRERLLGDILRFVKSTRPRSLGSDIAAKIGNTMQTLYSTRKPLAELKYPIRFFLSLMVSSDHASGAVSITKALAKHSPSFFTARFFVRLLGILMRCRQFKCAQQVIQIAREITPSRTIDIAQAKLVISLVNAGATTLACGPYPKHRIASSLRTRLSIARIMAFRSRRPSAHATWRILRILSRHPWDERAIQDAIVSLVRAQRTAAAMKLVRSKCTILTPKSITTIGNTILHGILRGKQRNGRHIARILGTKAFLEKTCRFTPDRVTTNIIVKAVLFLHPAIHISQMKSLFDHFIKLDFPSGPRWNHDNNVPFGSLLKTIPQDLQLPVHTSPPSFKRHVRPLFKMFIKAFYLRGDHDAAKKRNRLELLENGRNERGHGVKA
ncbi:hypothetical protein JOM56_001289 [Amanita muscaria]